jgi:2,4-diaminopentanoate dehydrogenase
MAIRVVNVGTGLVGQEALRAIVDHPDTELVGHVAHDPDKVGRDVGELIGYPPAGLLATADLDEALAAGPDVVSYFATTHGRLKVTLNDFCRILSSGVHIVTTSVGALIYPSSARPDVLERLNAACHEGNSTLFSTGVDPGFFSDYLPVVLSGCSRRIDGVRIYEMAVYESGPCEVEFTNAHGDNLAGGFGVTAMRAINAIPAVVAAPAGVLSVFDLPLITGRGRLALREGADV